MLHISSQFTSHKCFFPIWLSVFISTGYKWSINNKIGCSQKHMLLEIRLEGRVFLSTLPSGLLSSQAPTYQETDLAVHFHASLVSHWFPFCQAKCWNWAILSHFKINQHLLWWSFIHCSHCHLPPSVSSSLSSSICPWPPRNTWWVTLWGLTSPLQACQPQSAVIWCEMYALVQGSQGQGLVIDVAYSSVSCVFSPFLHSGLCLDKLFEDLL